MRNRVKFAVEHVTMKEEMREEIMKNLKEGRKTRHMGRRRAVMAAAAAATLIISIPVYAAVQSHLQARMEKLPEDKVSAVTEDIQKSRADADIFSRELTGEENTRKAELTRAYYKGTYPDGEILHLQEGEGPRQDMLCFDPATSTFYLPDRELSDEELLQIIDFNYIRDYSLSRQNQASGGLGETYQKYYDDLEVKTGEPVTEEEAVSIAASFLRQLYHQEPDGMELDHYYDEDYAGYMVTYSIQSHAYYYFKIQKETGVLLSARYSGGDYLENLPADTDLSEYVGSAYDIVTEIMESSFGRTADRDKLTCYVKLLKEEKAFRPMLSFLLSDGVQVHRLNFRIGTGHDGGVVLQDYFYHTAEEEEEEEAAEEESGEAERIDMMKYLN